MKGNLPNDTLPYLRPTFGEGGIIEMIDGDFL